MSTWVALSTNEVAPPPQVTQPVEGCCRRLSTLLEVANTIGRTLSVEALIGRIVECTTHALNCERSSFFVVDWDEHELWSMRAEGTHTREIRIAFGSGLASHAALDGSVINVADAYGDHRFNPSIDQRTGYRTRSVLCVPVLNRAGCVIGVCECMNRRNGPFDDDDVQLLQAIACQIAVAMDNATLHQREVATRRYLQKVHDSIASGVITLDASYRTVMCNPVACRLLPDLTPGGGLDIRGVLAGGNPGLGALIERAYRTGRPLARDDVSLIGPPRRRSTVNVRIVPLEDTHEGERGLVIVLHDITREQRVRHAFQHYLAPAVVEQIEREPDRLSLGGEQREVSALFTDLEGFASLAERLAPVRLVDLLNVYFNAMCKVVLRHGGTIDKIVGDSMHVLFNAPVDQHDHANRAVRCAMEMDACARELMDCGARGRELLGRTRIGVSSGLAVVGNFGGSARFDYTAHGDAVNVASRLEGANKYLGTRILVSDDTCNACSDIRFRPVGRLALDGRDAPVAVHEPVAGDTYPLACLSRYRRAYSLLAEGNVHAGGVLRSLLECCPRDELSRMHLERFDAGCRSDFIELPGK